MKDRQRRKILYRKQATGWKAGRGGVYTVQGAGYKMEGRQRRRIPYRTQAAGW
jgi:hypothetical protein